MKFYSTKNKQLRVRLREAVLQGLAPDGGLFMPEFIPAVDAPYLRGMTFQEIAMTLARPFTDGELSSNQLQEIIEDAFTFPVPLYPLSEDLHVLELFHGPTLAFKDFGARFMARLMAKFTVRQDRERLILVATSGDTGSAVASGFYAQPGMRVILLYPSGMVSKIQEQQLTTLGGNVTALEVDGSFDDCQRLVKQAFIDKDIREQCSLSSANSINIARLIPQSFYYAAAWSALPGSNTPLVMVVPSGNLGNLTAGLIARRMGIPILKFVSAMNANDVFLGYLVKGTFQPRPTIPTISNAMDVGNPSNYYRILDLYENDVRNLRKTVYGASFSDQDTQQAINQVYDQFNYMMDPHSAVGFLALQQFLSENKVNDWRQIILETAHPAKFKDIVESCTGRPVRIPQRLAVCLDKPKHAFTMSSLFSDFKEWLLSGAG